MLTIDSISATLTELDKQTITAAIKEVLPTKDHQIAVVLCNDSYILEKNKQSLKHDYYTDIITYYYNPKAPLEEAELLISKDRVEENANSNHVEYKHELSRVVIHGCLHLLGHDDQTDTQKKQMRVLENKHLKQLFHVEL